jgi:trans-aconitate methyltransferase
MNDRNSGSEKRWDASAYDNKHSFVWKYGEELLDLLAPREGERILDMGCGTAYLTNQIAARGAKVVGLDKSLAMIERARALYPELQLEVADATDFHFDEPFDGVFSNAAIHWMKDQDAVADAVFKALKQGGRFVAEFGGKGNIKKTRFALREVLDEAGYTWDREATRRYYASIGQYASLLEAHGFRVIYAAHFDRPTKLEGDESGLQRWLEVFADNELAGVPADDREKVIKLIEQRLRPELFRDGSWFLDYKRLRIVAIKD